MFYEELKIYIKKKNQRITMSELSVIYIFLLQFAFKGGFNLVRKLLENEDLDAPVSLGCTLC